MYDIITIGSAFQDVYVFSKKFRVCKDTRVTTGEVESFAFGTKIELDDILFEIGGGATNTAFTFARQSLRTACLTKVGADGAGDEVKKVLKKAKISTDLVVTDPRKRTAHSVIFLAPNGERTILVYRGASHEFKNKDINFKKLKNTKWLYITSIGGNITILRKIVNFANKNKIKIALNPGKLELKYGFKKLKPIFDKINILFLNREEAAELMPRSYTDDKGILSDLKYLSHNITVVTEGERGSLIYDGNHKYRVYIKPLRSIDTTGAGDAFGSGFVAGYIKKGTIERAVQVGAANAAGQVMKIGAKQGLISKNPLELKKWIKLLKIRIVKFN